MHDLRYLANRAKLYVTGLAMLALTVPAVAQSKADIVHDRIMETGQYYVDPIEPVFWSERILISL